ncbi:MAG: YqgE/AlgH family protein [Hyphomicrobiales bacterium]|nr:YqgE/AlgH family protein [Hyphomicrobiales bacterium]
MKKKDLDNELTSQDGYLEGQLLIASPSMLDPRFARTVVYLCAHTASGAMGIVINQPAPNIRFSNLLEQLDIIGENDIMPATQVQDMAVHLGGPVEKSRGFVLHSSDYFVRNSTLTVGSSICLTATIDILKALAAGSGPDRALMALGYAGWGAGQLESEIASNSWLNCDADADLIFNSDAAIKYELAFAKIGIDPAFLVSEAGHA